MDFLLILKAAALGIIEGITEFLPVSSTGHLILVENFLKLSSNSNFTASFEIIIQLGAILSVILFFWNRLWPFSGQTEERKEKWLLWAKVIVAVIPAVILGVLFDDFIEEKLFNPLTVSITLIAYGIIIIIIEVINAKKSGFKIDTVGKTTFITALMVGLFQCLAMVPGTSRSGATIIGAMIIGMSRTAAAEFSFFLAIPTIAGACLFKIVKTGFSFTSSEWLLIAVGFAVSFLTALGIIKLFMGYIQKRDFKIFGIYRVILGVVVILLLLKK